MTKKAALCRLVMYFPISGLTFCRKDSVLVNPYLPCRRIFILYLRLTMAFAIKILSPLNYELFSPDVNSIWEFINSRAEGNQSHGIVFLGLKSTRQISIQ